MHVPNLRDTHFSLYGVGLGIGRGQKLVLRRPAEEKVTP